MKRLVIVTYDYPPSNGGIARLCSDIAEGCKKKGQPYLVVTPIKGPSEENVVRITGKRPSTDFKILRYLRKHLTENDVILTGTFHPDGIIGVLSGHKTYFLGHGTEFFPGQTFFRKYIWSIYRKIVLRLPAGIITNSHYTEGLVRTCSPKAKVTALPLGVDHIKFHPTVSKTEDGILRLCSVSRLLKFKAQDFVIETIASLPEEYKNRIRFEIAGKGPYKEDLERLVKKHHLESIVSFVGYISDEDLCDFYSRNDLFVLTTRVTSDGSVEGFGLVFAEAQACGTACIGSRSGGIPDAIEENNGGWLIDIDNAEQLSSILINCLKDRNLVITQGKKARNRIEDSCNLDLYCNKLFSLILN